MRNTLPTNPHRFVRLFLLAFVVANFLGTTLFTGGTAFAVSPGSEEFFEQRIRPVLIEHCYECHSSESEEIGGSLWLDSKNGMMTGGDSGPTIVEGDAEASVLISALRYESSEMPPDGQLPDPVIEDFEKWINAGAMDPRTADNAGKELPVRQSIDLDQGRQFWAFQPLVDFRRQGSSDDSELAANELAANELAANELAASEPEDSNGLIDFLIHQRLEQQGIRPVPLADPQTRLRRLAFDLTGLPPQESLRQRWVAEPTEEVWAEIVDQMLHSREFAQHWARHWMDIARYADSNGSDFNATFHDAWRYRDYLIDSFDQDRPMDEMIRQQVAGDLLHSESDRQRYDNVVATTFLMLGPKMLSERDKPKLTLDVVDEQIDTVGRAFLGMTLGCARCHDHKFDPIPTEDYYALAGIFKSTQTLNGESQQYVSTWNRVELPTTPEHRTALSEHKQQVSSLEKRIKKAKSDLEQVRRKIDMRWVVDDTQATQTGNWTSSTYTKGYVGEGYVHDNNANKGEFSIEFRKRLPENGKYVVRFAYNTNSNRAAKVPVTIQTADGTEKLFVNQRQKLDTAPWGTLGTYLFSADSDAVVTIRNEGTDGYVIVDAIQFLPVALAKGEGKQESNSNVDSAVAAAQKKLDRLNQELETLKKNAPKPLPVAMAPRDFATDKIGDSPVHIRGEVANVGQVVPRGFLQVCGPGDASISVPQGSGRLELAQWLTDPDNPLVARVMVNRVWMHVFGQGIVRTVDNFGTRGERPSHPELLDALATDFMRNGWKVKPLIRQMVLSETYARSSAHDANGESIDPENRLLWRAHRKRIPAESIRDTMLVAAGAMTDDELVEPVADKGVLVTKNNGDTKKVASGIDQPVRSIYLPVIRGNIPALMTSLDAADPDLLVGKRPTTNVPGQALVLLNSKNVIAWANQTADRIAEEATATTWAQRIAKVYRLCLSRDPSAKDYDIAAHYLGVTDDELNEAIAIDDVGKERLRDFVAAIFASTEFRLLD